ncbi:zinc finger protein 846-like [Neocloeon triangulifer]|uniref:zinc finger protein 846-like n=1 Tax=Neocloeon triangulifer TaxID=2078957 RepID=UPI00286F9F7C|nr:zinc finger protein 846-like [Neocloeon triangulifer]
MPIRAGRTFQASPLLDSLCKIPDGENVILRMTSTASGKTTHAGVLKLHSTRSVKTVLCPPAVMFNLGLDGNQEYQDSTTVRMTVVVLPLGDSVTIGCSSWMNVQQQEALRCYVQTLAAVTEGDHLHGGKDDAAGGPYKVLQTRPSSAIRIGPETKIESIKVTTQNQEEQFLVAIRTMMMKSVADKRRPKVASAESKAVEEATAEARDSEGAAKCRLCGRKKPSAEDIFATKGLATLIEDCLRIKVEEEDGLPHLICPECVKKLRSWRVFHDRAHETQQSLSFGVKNRVALERHKCGICGEQFGRSKAFAEHLASHAGQKFVCPVCGRQLASEEGLVRHQEVHAAQRNHCCHLCGRLFQTLTCLLQHVRLQHRPQGTPTYLCPVCQKSFTQRAHLDLHVRTHTGERPFGCEQCSARFVSSGQLQRHVAGVHERKKRFKCTHCEKEFLYAHNFKAHLARHEGNKEVSCEQCDKTFFTKNALFRHQRVHSKEKPFPCDICGKTFADCSNRKRHMQNHTTSSAAPTFQTRPKDPELLLVALNTTDGDLSLNTLSGAPLSPPLPLPLALSPTLPSSPIQLPPSDFLLPLNNY